MYNFTKDTVKEEDLVITTNTINVEQNIIELGILWVGFLIAFIITAVHVFRSHQTHAEEGSSGDTNRTLFYKLLAIALLSRLVFIPISIYCDGDMFQLVADTLPQLTFASAWALLVAFFAQLVGTATGTVATSPHPSLLIHLACYITYVILVILYWWNDSAAVLLEAGLCCLYAALFGTLIYFGPKLVVILHPSLERQSGLAVRLVAACSIGNLVFLAKSISLGLTVVVPTSTNPPWYIYGVLELLPTYLLLVMMHPSSKETNHGETMRRIPSNSGGRVRSAGEMSSLLKAQPQYGSKEGP